MNNTTLAGNAAGYEGGGVFNFGTLNATNSTITGNSAGSPIATGGGIDNNVGTANLNNTIVNGNSATQTHDLMGSPLPDPITIYADMRGGYAGTNNIVGPVNATAMTPDGEQVFAEIDPSTGGGLLADNGGPTQTVLILQGGAAQNAGSDTQAAIAGLTTDARGAGFSRVAVGQSDIGAVELQSLVVTTLDDEAAGTTDLATEAADGGGLSLREAIAVANATAGADTITFDAALAGGLVRLTGGEIAITDATTIDGGGLGITITGDASGNDSTVAGTDITDVAATGATNLADNSRIFGISGMYSFVTIDGLTLTGGRTTADNEFGGAINSVNDLTILNSTVSGNSTTGTNAVGGGLHSAGRLTLINSTVSNNSTTGDNAVGGGAHGSAAMLVNSTVSGNSTAGTNAEGGGLVGYFYANLINSTVTGNSTAGSGSTGGGLAFGPAGSPILNNSIVMGNVTNFTGVGGDDLDVAATLTGGNIIGSNIYSGAMDVGDTTAAAVFAATVETLADVNGDGIPETGTGVFGGVLADNGGPVRTIALLQGGAAQNAGSQATRPLESDFGVGDVDGDGTVEMTAISIDARGRDRVFDMEVDLGAFEINNNAPTVVVSSVVMGLKENTNTSLGVKVADIVITDDVYGIDVLGLTGTDAADFEIRMGNELFFIGASPNFETKSSYAVTVTVDDATVGVNPDDTADFTLAISNVSPEYIFGTAVGDFLFGGTDRDIMFGFGGSDLMRGGTGNDVMRGHAGIDRMFGDNGADRMFGGNQNDVMRGGNQNDFLFGENNNDRMFGDGGNDVMTGGRGRDIMNGGSGRDRFEYNNINESRGALRDRIDGFKHNQDDIDLRTIDANTTVGGNQRFKFIGDDSFNRVAGELHIRTVGAITKVEGDINGDGRADFVIDVTGGVNLTGSDFFL